MQELTVWEDIDEETIYCPLCNSTLPRPEEMKFDFIRCPHCDGILHNESELFEKVVVYLENVYAEDGEPGVQYDEYTEILKHFMYKFAHLYMINQVMDPLFSEIQCALFGNEFPIEGETEYEDIEIKGLKMLAAVQKLVEEHGGQLKYV